MEYWRWWVIHLWVEGFFEVFSTTLMAFIFVTLGLVSYRAGTVAAISSGAIYLIGGIPGTFHHLYFTGVTSTIVATGASFSALEVVPLVLLGYEAFENYTRLHSAPWMHRLKWPVYCFIAVSFWNLVGAGVFGFLINMPVSLFYIQGLNTTAVHAHTALFGVYGFLSLGFVFLIARYIRPEVEFNDKLMNELCIYGAFEENKLIGIMGTKNEGKHISLFFIKKEFHRKGIGKQLFDYSQCDCPANEITVNSSTYAIRFYESLGFEKTNDRQQTNGISYTPMKLISNK